MNADGHHQLLPVCLQLSPIGKINESVIILSPPACKGNLRWIPRLPCKFPHTVVFLPHFPPHAFEKMMGCDPCPSSRKPVGPNSLLTLSSPSSSRKQQQQKKGESAAITPIQTRLRKFSRARLPLWKLCKDWRNACSHANKPQNKTRDAAFGLDFVQPGVTVPVKSPSRILVPGSSLGVSPCSWF